MKSDIEDLVQAQLDAAMRRQIAPQDKLTDIQSAVEDIRRFTEVVSKVLDRPEAEPQILPLEIGALPSSSPDLTDILQEMRKLSSAAVGILNRPVERNVTPLQPAPVVNVSPPAVSISPEIVVQRNNTRYRVTVTQRDNSAQMRIKELIIEPIE